MDLRGDAGKLSFYEDIPAEEKLDFFKKPADFLASAASSKDQKGGYVFSHVDSVLTTSRATSTYPCFGFEAALVRELNALRVLYVQPNSPAKEAGLKRGDWIIAIDSQKYQSVITPPISPTRPKPIALHWENTIPIRKKWTTRNSTT